MSRLDEERDRVRQLVERNPADLGLKARLGAIHEQRNEFMDAIGCYSAVVAVDMHNLDVWSRLGFCFMRLFKLDEALETFGFVLGMNPDHLDSLYGRAVCLENKGDHAQALEVIEHAVKVAPDNPNLYPFRAYLIATHGKDPVRTREAFCDWGRRFADPLTAKAPRLINNRNPGRKLRIGYVSADLRDHAVAYFVEPVFEHHDHKNFEIHVFATGPADRVTARIRRHVDQWADVTSMNDEQVASLIRRRGIDILIDLSGHTMGNRLLAFARRPAPVQATWLGFMYTTGMQAMDYRITDFGVDPVGSNEGAHSETLFRLAGGMAVYQPPPDTPLAEVPPMLETGRPVFASLNNLKKVTDPVLRLWKRVMDEVPDAILLLIGYERTQEEAIAQQRGRLEAAGLPLDRLCILPRLALDGFMQLGTKADVALDTFPLSGGTTTLHSLWMGLPVVSMGGGQAFESASASTLAGVGLPELIAADEDAYVKKAVELVRNPEYLTNFRRTIRDTMKKCPMMGYERFTRDLEAAYRLMWLNHVAGEKRYLDTTVSVEQALADLRDREAVAA
jgi:predicted O-linked N-acetylglucosamine transferase (SPINDLY family)